MVPNPGMKKKIGKRETKFGEETWNNPVPGGNSHAANHRPGSMKGIVEAREKSGVSCLFAAYVKKDQGRTIRKALSKVVLARLFLKSSLVRERNQ
jgi:hypothetical protein